MALSDPVLSCAESVRKADYDRYLSVLFAPKEKRPALFALYAFNFEVAKTAEMVSEPPLGLIRLQWWREAVEGIYCGDLRRHEVIAALHHAVTAHALPRNLFDEMIDAREKDLLPSPFATPLDLQSYADATAGHLIRLAARILDADGRFDQDAHSLGIAYALTGLLRALPHHAAAWRIMLPLSELSKAGVSEAEIYAGQVANIRTLIDRTIAMTEAHLLAAAGAEIPRVVLPAFLPAALVRPYLEKTKRRSFDPYRHPLELSVPRKQLAMAAALLRGRI